MTKQEYEKILEMLNELKIDIEIRFNDYIDEIKTMGNEPDDKYANLKPADDIFNQNFEEFAKEVISEREAEKQAEQEETDSHTHN